MVIIKQPTAARCILLFPSCCFVALLQWALWLQIKRQQHMITMALFLSGSSASNSLNITAPDPLYEWLIGRSQQPLLIIFRVVLLVCYWFLWSLAVGWVHSWMSASPGGQRFGRQNSCPDIWLFFWTQQNSYVQQWCSAIITLTLHTKYCVRPRSEINVLLLMVFLGSSIFSTRKR